MCTDKSSWCQFLWSIHGFRIDWNHLTISAKPNSYVISVVSATSYVDAALHIFRTSFAQLKRESSFRLLFSATNHKTSSRYISCASQHLDAIVLLCNRVERLAAYFWHFFSVWHDQIGIKLGYLPYKLFKQQLFTFAEKVGWTVKSQHFRFFYIKLDMIMYFEMKLYEL